MKEHYKLNQRLETYLRWPIILSVILFLMNLLTYIVDVKAGLLVTAFIVTYIILSILIYAYNKKQIMSDIISFSKAYTHTQKELLDNFAIPYAVLDRDSRIIWHNYEFVKIVDNERIVSKPITNIISEITKEALPKGDTAEVLHIIFKNRDYRVELKKINVNSSENNNQTELFTVYMFDETEIKELIRVNKEQKLVSGLIYIDNYEEALQSIEEVRRPLLVALIDRNINKFTQNIDAIARKLEKDKYFIVFQQKYLHQLQSSKFVILDDIRSVNIGNEMPVTLSIGLGTNGDTFLQCADYARTAMDLALGRGGDQAVIKDRDKIYYYGGKTKVVEKSTRVKSRVKAHAFRELIEAKDKVIIMGHKLQDMDSLGAAIGIYRGAKTLNKKAHIVLNEVTISIRPLLELFLNDEEYEEDMFIKSSTAIEKADDNTLLVVVDVNRPSYTECPELLELIPTIVVFDHHRQSSESIDNAVLSYVEPYASSTCEMVAEILQYLVDKLRLRPLEADALFAGMTVDTKNFMSKTGVKTFETAAFLRKSGADVVRVRKLFRNDLSSYKAKAEAIKNAEVYKDYLAISICPSGDIESPTVVTAQAADELLNISGIKASFVFTKFDNRIYISARSIDEINVQLIMERLGGGGHLNVAGAQLENSSIEDAIKQLKNIIDHMKLEGEL